jgi:hypothetical protein
MSQTEGRQQFATQKVFSTSSSSSEEEEEVADVRPLLKLTPREEVFAQTRYQIEIKNEDWVYQDLINAEKERMKTTTIDQPPATVSYDKDEFSFYHVSELNFEKDWKEQKITFPIEFVAADAKDVIDEIHHIRDQALSQNQTPPSIIYISKWTVSRKVTLAIVDPKYCLWDLERYLAQQDKTYPYHLNLLGDGYRSEIAEYMEDHPIRVKEYPRLDGWINMVALPNAHTLQSYMLFGRTVKDLVLKKPSFQYVWNADKKKYE